MATTFPQDLNMFWIFRFLDMRRIQTNTPAMTTRIGRPAMLNDLMAVRVPRLDVVQRVEPLGLGSQDGVRLTSAEHVDHVHDELGVRTRPTDIEKAVLQQL